MLNFIDNQREIKIFEPQNYLQENFWNLLDIFTGNLLEFHSQDLVATLRSVPRAHDDVPPNGESMGEGGYWGPGRQSQNGYDLAHPLAN